MRQSDKYELSEVFKRTINARHGYEVVADDLGIKNSTLRTKLAALYSEGANTQMGLLTTIEIMENTKNPEPLLTFINEHFGYLPPIRQPSREISGETIHVGLTRIAKEVGDVARVAMEITDPNSLRGTAIDKRERAKLKKEIMEAAAQLMQLDVDTGAVVELRPDDQRRGG